jgi:hypothetical protein
MNKQDFEQIKEIAKQLKDIRIRNGLDRIQLTSETQFESGVNNDIVDLYTWSYDGVCHHKSSRAEWYGQSDKMKYELNYDRYMTDK